MDTSSAMFLRIAALLSLIHLIAAVPLQSVVKTVTSADGTKIYADATGNPSKQSIVFVHGGALSGIVYDRLFNNAKLKSNYYLVRYDLRGHGRSDKPTSPDFYTQDAIAGDFGAVVTAFNLKKPLFVGWSLSAAVIGDIAYAFDPLPILGAIALGGGPAYGPDLVPLFSGPNGALGDFFQDTNVTASVLAHHRWVDALFRDPGAIPFNVRMEYLGQSFLQTPSAMTLFSPLREQNRTRLLEVGESGELWLKILFGAQDQNVLADAVIEYYRPHFKHFDAVKITGGHAVFEDNPEETVEEIIQFIRKIPRRRS